MPLAGFISFQGSKTTRKIMRVNNFAIFCEFDRALTPVAPRVGLCRRRRVPRLRLPAPSLNLFLVAMAFFIASCAIAVWAQSYLVFLSSRFLQACGNGVLIPLVQSHTVVEHPSDGGYWL